MDGKVDVLGPIKMIYHSFSVTYSFYVLKKEWTEYRGVFFTIKAPSPAARILHGCLRPRF